MNHIFNRYMKKIRFPPVAVILCFTELFCNSMCVIARNGAEICTILKVDQKYMEGFEVRCWGRMEKISWTDQVRNKEAFRMVEEERNSPHTIN